MVQVVNLGEEGQEGGGHEADQPDQGDHFFGFSCGGFGEEEIMGDILLVILYQNQNIQF